MSTPLTSHKIAFANTLRGICAVLVLIYHYCVCLFLDRDWIAYLSNTPALDANLHPTPETLLLFKTLGLSLGPFAVGIFFIISGFVLPFSLKKISGWQFVGNRTLRIMPVYIAGFTLTLCILGFCSHFFGNPFPYSWKHIFVHYIPGIRDVLGTPLIDGIMWTLEIEVKFYLLCLLMIYWFKRNSLLVFVPPFLLGSIALYFNLTALSFPPPFHALTLTYPFVTQNLLFIFIGVAFHYLFCEKLRPLSTTLLILALFGLDLAIWKVGPHNGFFAQSQFYAGAVLAFSFAYAYPQFFKGNRVFHYLANISYPLYVIHSVSGWGLIRVLLACEFPAWQAISLVTVFFFIMATLLHYFIEAPSQKLAHTLALSSPGKIPRATAALNLSEA